MEVNKNLVINKRYEVIKSIDEGGTSLIFLVYDNKLSQNFAMKVLKQEYSKDPLYVKAFTREINRLKKLKSSRARGIVQIRNYSTQGSLMYYVMDYVEGKTLKSMIENDELSFDEKLEIASGICSAMQFAHGAGIVHGDIKSANIIIDKDRKPVVLDFGNLDDSDNDDSEILGTVEYFSPEQARGEKPDKSSDIYSTGVVFYELFTGHLPFKGNDQTSLALHHLYSLPSFSEEDGENTTESIRRIIYKALRKSKGDRYQNFTKLHEDVLRSMYDESGSFVEDYQDVTEEGKVVVREEQPQRSRKFIHFLYIAIAVPLILISVFLGIKIIKSVRKDKEMISMPNFENIPMKEAIAIAEEKGFKTKISYELSMDVNQDYVIRQMPVVGTKLAEGDEIELVVSLGSERGLLMPDLLNLDIDLAVDRLRDLSITNVEIEYTYEEGRDNNIVLDQNPGSGEVIEEDSQVIIIANHEKVKLAEDVPNFAGKSIVQSGTALDGSGFLNIFVKYEDVDTSGVVSQYPTSDMAEIPLLYMRLNAGLSRDTVKKKISLGERTINMEEESNHILVCYAVSHEGVEYNFIIMEMSEEQGEGYKRIVLDDIEFELDREFDRDDAWINIFNNYEIVKTIRIEK